MTVIYFWELKGRSFPKGLSMYVGKASVSHMTTPLGTKLQKTGCSFLVFMMGDSNVRHKAK